MSRPIVAQLSVAALNHNIAAIRRKAAGKFIWGVVKADAYGHGLLNLLPTLGALDGLALLDPSAALEARAAGWTKKLLLIEGFFTADDIPELARSNIETVVHSLWQIAMLEENPTAEKIAVHVKLNSGMNRLGFRPEEVDGVLARLAKIANVRVVGFVNHFANSDLERNVAGKASVDSQLSRVARVHSNLAFSLSNSSAIFFHEIREEEVRAGIVLYGVSPNDVPEKELGLLPVMRLKTRVIAMQDLKEGDQVGYGSNFTAVKPMRIAVIACGYADGYLRHADTTRVVAIEGRLAPIVGNVSMDMITIDVTGIESAAVGSEVELWGEHIPVNSVAKASNTIGYELLCNVNPRVPRQIID